MPDGAPFAGPLLAVGSLSIDQQLALEHHGHVGLSKGSADVDPWPLTDLVGELLDELQFVRGLYACTLAPLKKV